MVRLYEKMEKMIVRLTAQTMSNFYCKYCKKNECNLSQHMECFESLEKQLKEFAESRMNEKVNEENYE